MTMASAAVVLLPPCQRCLPHSLQLLPLMCLLPLLHMYTGAFPIDYGFCQYREEFDYASNGTYYNMSQQVSGSNIGSGLWEGLNQDLQLTWVA